MLPAASTPADQVSVVLVIEYVKHQKTETPVSDPLVWLIHRPLLWFCVELLAVANSQGTRLVNWSCAEEAVFAAQRPLLSDSAPVSGY